MKPVSYALYCVRRSQVSCEGVGVGYLQKRCDFRLRDAQQPFSLPPPLGDTEEQTIFPDEMQGRVRLRQTFLPVHHSNLYQTISQPVGDPLFLPKGTPVVTWWYRLENRLEDWGPCSPTHSLSVAIITATWLVGDPS